MKQINNVIVGGLGNPLMGDEGIGIYITRELVTRWEQFSHVDFIELGTSPMNVVHAIAGRQKAVLIDCALMNEPAGTIRRFTPNDVVSGKEMPGFSLHESDLLDAIKLSLTIGECPEEIVIFGIQPESMEFGKGLSAVLQGQIEEYLDVIITDL